MVDRHADASDDTELSSPTTSLHRRSATDPERTVETVAVGYPRRRNAGGYTYALTPPRRPDFRERSLASGWGLPVVGHTRTEGSTNLSPPQVALLGELRRMREGQPPTGELSADDLTALVELTAAGDRYRHAAPDWAPRAWAAMLLKHPALSERDLRTLLNTPGTVTTTVATDPEIVGLVIAHPALTPQVIAEIVSVAAWASRPVRRPVMSRGKRHLVGGPTNRMMLSTEVAAYGPEPVAPQVAALLTLVRRLAAGGIAAAAMFSALLSLRGGITFAELEDLVEEALRTA